MNASVVCPEEDPSDIVLVVLQHKIINNNLHNGLVTVFLQSFLH